MSETAAAGALGPTRALGIRAAEARPRDDWRLMLVMLAFVAAYAVLMISMGRVALSEPEEPALGSRGRAAPPVRGEIVDRNGQLLAANLPAWSLYANPRDIRDPVAVAAELAGIFPDEDPATLLRRLTQRGSFVWLKRPITPAQRQRVMELGRPGLMIGNRDMRIYPAGPTVSHILGSVVAEVEDVRFAELVGASGIESAFDARLRDPARTGEPLELSIDLSAQAALREVLAADMARFGAAGAAGVLLDIHTGEIIAMVSLPDYDPNDRPASSPPAGDANPRFNRAVQGLYELGSTFKVLTVAFALDAGITTPETIIENAPFSFGRKRISDSHPLPARMPVGDIIVKSSNVGAAKLAIRLGTPRFRAALGRLGLLDPVPLELGEAAAARPIQPKHWPDISTVTMSYGYGLAVSPLHLAAAMASVTNGGRKVRPTLLKGGHALGERVISPETSAALLPMLRDTVIRGTGKRAEVAGYEIGGKTGTAEKVRPEGGYFNDRNVTTFAAVFPTSNPAYALVVSLDDAADPSVSPPGRTAGRVAAPAAGEAVRRIAPILGIRPLDPPPPPESDGPEALFGPVTRAGGQ